MKALKDFGIKLNWKFVFLGPGTTVNPVPNTLFVDLGNRLTEGIIDTHHSDDYKSSAHALKERPDLVLNHLLTNLNEAYARGEQDRLNNLAEMEFTFVTHVNPDWDGIATFYLCNHLLINGSLPEPRWLTDLLVEATNQIDQGKARMEGKTKRPFLILYDIMGDEKIKHKETLEQGLNLIEAIIAKIKKKNFHDCPPGNPFLEHFNNLEEILPDYSGHLERLKKDRIKYEQDVEEKADFFEVELPLKKSPKGKGKPFKANCKAIAFKTPPSCTLHKYWVRDEGKHQLLLIPTYKKDTTDINNWIVSVDPNGEFDLKRLGYLLEKAEKNRRLEMGDKYHRPGIPRWDDEKYSDNSDPWFDGRDSEETIVDSPRCGTELNLADIKQVLEQRFHGIRLEESPNNNLAFYFFFEIPEEDGGQNTTRENLNRFLKDAGLREAPVLKNLDKAFQFIKKTELWISGCPQDKENGFKATLWASEITRHCVLQLQVKDFQKTVGAHESPVILEDLAETVEKIESQARNTADEIRKHLELEREIWGLECFRLLELSQPDLQFHSKGKIQNVFDTLLRDKLSEKQINRLIEGEGTEEIRTSHALCVLNKDRQETEGGELSQRQLMLFYSLFLKTGYRNFSVRIGGIVENIIKSKNNDYEKDLKEIQEDYSAFLGRYEFSEREINTDDGLQNFFKSALKAMGFQEQRDETRHEMQTTFELAAAKNRKAIEKGNILLNCLILFLGIMALGDFLHGWFTADENVHGWLAENKISEGPVVLVGLLILAGVCAGLLWCHLNNKRSK
jgi:hypothetical protein